MISPAILRTLVLAAPATIVVILVTALGSAISYRAGDSLAGNVLWVLTMVLIGLLGMKLLLLLFAVALRQLHEIEGAPRNEVQRVRTDGSPNA